MAAVTACAQTILQRDFSCNVLPMHDTSWPLLTECEIVAAALRMQLTSTKGMHRCHHPQERSLASLIAERFDKLEVV
jgi:hypothetical protein